ncbi:MAG: Holliday junction branch migration protein RuvA [Gammaproteobacteria bacterium]|nr:Holliday junction branch migration protein RuvA [Gammaproteobacteria bacterium]
MIGRLTGKLVDKKAPTLLLDVNGVGYEIEAPMTTFYDLPETGSEVLLHTHLVVREDAQLLYGFSRETQRNLFRNLLKVSGVGPRVALAILSGMSTEEFFACMASEDVDRLVRVPGIGRKTAQRLVVELRDRLGAAGTAGIGDGMPVSTDPAYEAISALVSLGYRPAEARRAVLGLGADGASSEDLIRQALKVVAGGSK